jgi:hypothetical protein
VANPPPPPVLLIFEPNYPMLCFFTLHVLY